MATMNTSRKIIAPTRKIIDILSMPTSSFTGFLSASSKESLVYMKGGIRIHTLPMNHELKEYSKPHIKYAEFVDMRGNITDEFWGCVNDFNLWFLGNYAKI